MPVSFVNVSLVSFAMSSICGLPTISTLIDVPSPPEPDEPPAPLQATSSEPAAVAVARTWIVLRVRMTDSRNVARAWGTRPTVLRGGGVVVSTAAQARMTSGPSSE
ncbi:hypothetical protein GCM10020256_26390 [Streptomyces thermocoprophilus]